MGTATTSSTSDIAEGGVFGQWPHEPGAQIVALSPFGLMQSSARPASLVCRWRCAAFGVYVHLAKRVLKVGETTAFSIVVAPANAANKAVSPKLSDGIAQLDAAGHQLTAPQARQGAADGDDAGRGP